MNLYDVKAKRYAQGTKRIHKLKVEKRGIVPAKEEILDIYQIANAMEKGNKFVVPGPKGDVEVLLHLKSERNGTPVDNLDNLQEF